MVLSPLSVRWPNHKKLLGKCRSTNQKVLRIIFGTPCIAQFRNQNKEKFINFGFFKACLN